MAFFNENLGYVLGYGGVYRTENGGQDWVNNWLPVVPYRGAWDMSFADDRTGYLLGSRYTDPDPSILYRTTDGGATWTGVAGSKASILRTVLAISFVDGMTGWAGGGVIMKTTDGGESWTTQVPIATVREFLSFEAAHGFAVGGKTILRTKDGGDTWENVTPKDDRIKDLRSVYFLDANERMGRRPRSGRAGGGQRISSIRFSCARGTAARRGRSGISPTISRRFRACRSRRISRRAPRGGFRGIARTGGSASRATAVFLKKYS